MLWDHIMNDFDYNIEYTDENTNWNGTWVDWLCGQESVALA
jgi:hypothetical protein